MGCDIHGVVEYEEKIKHGDGSAWWSAIAIVDLDRDYALFGALAGVRIADIPHIEPRGLPSALSWRAVDEALDYIVSGEAEPGENEVSLAEVDKRLSWGCERYGDNYIAQCDWHTFSYLNTAELETALQAERDFCAVHWPEDAVPRPDIQAVLAMMKQLEAQGYSTRFVFWFDN